jgi:hemerythrin
MIRDKAGNIVSNKEKVLQRLSEYYEKHFELEDEQTVTMEKSG